MRALWWAVGPCLALAAFLVPAPATAEGASRERSKIELGRRLFMDPAVSRAGKFSCASCHDPEHGFSDPRVKSEDENGVTVRHSQSLLDLQDGVGMHWDGEFDSLRELLTARLAPMPEVLDQTRALLQRHFEISKSRGRSPDTGEYQKRLRELTPPYYGPITPRTPNRPLPGPLVQRVVEGGFYKDGFRLAFGSSTVTTKRMVDAMEAYLLSLRSNPAPYDRFVSGEPEALSESARRGHALFAGAANCAQCHEPAGFGQPAGFGGGGFRNTGVTFQNVTLSFNGRFTGDGGFGDRSFAPADLGKFKTPGLRDVALRAPYMHDGSFATLRDVVDYYNRGGTRNGRIDKHVKALNLDDRQVSDLVAFLESLTSETRPGLGQPSRRVRTTRVRLLDLQKKPLKNVDVAIHPCGDRLEDADPVKAPMLVTTNDLGWIEFEFPLWTHVKLTADGYEIGETRMLPDYVNRLELPATPLHLMSVVVVGPKGGSAMPSLLKVRLAHTSSEATVLRKVRQWNGRHALYVAKADAELGRKPRLVHLSLKGHENVLVELDFKGGASPMIDYRTE